MQSRPAPAPISPETVSQAGAGALLLTAAAVELWLSFWAAGWPYRGGALLVAVAGAFLLARALTTVVPLPPWVKPARQALRPDGSPLIAAGRVALADVAQR